MIFQDPYASLNPRWRVERIIAEPIRAFGLLKGDEIGNRVGELLTLVGLHPDDGRKFPHEFSGVSVSALRLPARWPRVPSSLSAMSRPRRSTFRFRPRS